MEVDNVIARLVDRLSNFTGESGQDVEFFFQKFERLAVVAGWTDIRKGVVIPLFLEDKAYFAYEMLNDEQRARYDLVKAAMIGQFRSNKLNLILWEDLKNSVKVDGQNVSDFYYKLQYNMSSAFFPKNRVCTPGTPVFSDPVFLP